MSKEIIRSFALESAGEVQVEFLDEPPEPPKDKRIHKRRFIPKVPEAPRYFILETDFISEEIEEN